MGGFMLVAMTKFSQPSSCASKDSIEHSGDEGPTTAIVPKGSGLKPSSSMTLRRPHNASFE